MWYCKLCQVTFTFESIEHHVYTNHVKPKIGQVKVYKCGECGFAAEGGFEDIAIHCIRFDHEPTQVVKGANYDGYVPQLFTALEEIMFLNNKLGSSSLQETKQQTAVITPPGNVQIDDQEATDGKADAIDWSDPYKQYEPVRNGQPINEADDSELDLTAKTYRHKEVEPSRRPSLLSTAPSSHSTSFIRTQKDAGSSQPNSMENTDYQRAGLSILSTDNNPPPSSILLSADDDQKMTHPCAYCPKRFGDAWKVKTHQRTHTGEKPYECPTCRKTFSRSDHLSRHKQLHTSGKTKPN